MQEGTEAEGLRQVGFGAIAPFAGCSGSADAGKQPSSSLEREVGLREGAYQLPLILGYPGVGKGAHRLDDGRLTEANPTPTPTP